MIFPQDRVSLRQMYAEAWRKKRENLPMEALELQIADVVVLHPEYHALLENDTHEDRDFHGDDGQSNPYMHMGLHLAIRDQLATDRPAGFAKVYRHYLALAGDVHLAEHQIMEVLAESLWEAQRSGRPPDEGAYLERLRIIAGADLQG